MKIWALCKWHKEVLCLCTSKQVRADKWCMRLHAIQDTAGGGTYSHDVQGHAQMQDDECKVTCHTLEA